MFYGNPELEISIAGSIVRVPHCSCFIILQTCYMQTPRHGKRFLSLLQFVNILAPFTQVIYFSTFRGLIMHSQLLKLMKTAKTPPDFPIVALSSVFQMSKILDCSDSDDKLR